MISELTKASVLGGNLFAYCENNAVMGYDPTGQWVFAWGMEFSAGCLLGCIVGFGGAIDNNWNLSFYLLGGVSIITGYSISSTCFYTYYSNMKSSKDVGGWGLSVGVSVGFKFASVSASFECSIGKNKYGGALSGGGSISSSPLSFFVNCVYAKEIFTINIANFIKGLKTFSSKVINKLGYQITITNKKEYLEIKQSYNKRAFRIYKNKELRYV